MTAAGERRPPPGGLRYWMPFVLAAAALQAGGLLLKPAGAVRTAQPGPPPVTRFYSPAPAASDARDLAPDARTLWSPILFSLPTPQGFSGALDDSAGARPPLRHPDAPPVLWPDGAPSGAGARPARLAALRSEAITYLATFAEPRPATPEWDAPGQAPVPPRLTFSDGVTADDFDVLPLPGAANGAASPQEELRAVLEFDSRGLPVRVIIDPPAADPAYGARATRTLLDWRMKPGKSPRAVTVRLRGAVPTTVPETAP